MSPKLSVIIIARNEEHDLPDCLASVSFADEIIVVDSGSTDRTREIASAAGAKVLLHEWQGYGLQKAFALSQASGEWILSLDADERCSQKLQNAIPNALINSEIDAYSICFETWLFGRRVRYGGFQNEFHIRLFRREKGEFSKKAVHEGVTVSGKIARLSTPIVHYTYSSLHEYIDKLNKYTDAAANEKYNLGIRFSKTALFRLPWSFFKRYILQLGILDGYQGALFALLSGFYDLVKYGKLYDLERRTAKSRLPLGVKTIDN